MSEAGTRSASATPPALRILHAIVFLGFASAAMAGTHQELLQLWRVVTQPFNSGTPPHPVACAAGLLSALMALVLVARVGLGKTVPLWVSALMLVAFAGSFTTLLVEPKARTVPGANVKCLDQAKALHRRVNEELQKNGQLPTLSEVQKIEGTSPFFRRPFTPLAWRIEAVNRTDALPEGAEPGWILFQASADQASFVITAVGIDADGAPSLLRQDNKAVEYRGAYNPDTMK